MQSDSSKPIADKKRSDTWKAPVAVLSVVGLYFATQIVGGLLLFIYPKLHHWSDIRTNDWLTNSVYAQFFYILIVETLMMFAIWQLLKLYKWSWRTIGLIRPTLKQIGWGILAVVPYLLFYVLLVSAAQALFPSLNVDQKQEIGFNGNYSSIELVFVFVSLVVLPPLVEEITMRGFLYSGVRTMLPKFMSALVVSGIFGLAHLAQGGDAGPLWIGFIDTFALSMVLVWLREHTGGLWAGMVLHSIKNGVAFVALFILHLN